MTTSLIAVLIKVTTIIAVMLLSWRFLLRGLLPGHKRQARDKRTPGLQVLEAAALTSLYAGMTRVVENQMLATAYLGGFCVFLIIQPRAFRVLLGALSLIFALAAFDLHGTTLWGYSIIVLFFLGRILLGDRPEPWKTS